MPPLGHGRPLLAAHAMSARPAGTSLIVATNSGLVAGRTSFMATMEVPQRKKGETSAAPPSTAANPVAASSSAASPPLAGLLLSDAPSTSPSSSLTTHAASIPTITHSMASSSTGPSAWASIASSTRAPALSSVAARRVEPYMRAFSRAPRRRVTVRRRSAMDLRFGGSAAPSDEAAGAGSDVAEKQVAPQRIPGRVGRRGERRTGRDADTSVMSTASRGAR